MRIGEDILKKLSEPKYKIRLAVVIGIVGVILIMLSELMPEKSADSVASETAETSSGDESELYKLKVQRELEKLLEQIEGVGDCEVMVTVEGTTEYVYAENVSRSADNDSGRQSNKLDTAIAYSEQNGQKQALVKKVIKPKINGVVIVCSGGGDIKVNERVLKAVSTALDISSGRICVEEKRK